PGREFQMTLTWADVARLKKRLTIPMMLKGIATAEDATLAVEHGVEVVYVSNHGGRQLDHGRGTMDMMPEIVEAVGGKALIVIDGGFCRGTDIVKAMAAGADLVGLGRMQCFGLAAAGEAGVVRMLELLEHEVQICFGLLGVTRWSELDRSYLHPAPAVEAARTLGAFPLLSIADEAFY
ncbi:MAG TPA: alpha-hydroxy acid oxidase, partial [Alphaproteobacteria bacterium]|nr:alpha-hydroxy acid oxidase [Alphaproteobacteria bacterium]